MNKSLIIGIVLSGILVLINTSRMVSNPSGLTALVLAIAMGAFLYGCGALKKEKEIKS